MAEIGSETTYLRVYLYVAYFFCLGFKRISWARAVLCEIFMS